MSDHSEESKGNDDNVDSGETRKRQSDSVVDVVNTFDSESDEEEKDETSYNARSYDMEEDDEPDNDDDGDERDRRRDDDEDEEDDDGDGGKKQNRIIRKSPNQKEVGEGVGRVTRTSVDNGGERTTVTRLVSVVRSPS